MEIVCLVYLLSIMCLKLYKSLDYHSKNFWKYELSFKIFNLKLLVDKTNKKKTIYFILLKLILIIPQTGTERPA